MECRQSIHGLRAPLLTGNTSGALKRRTLEHPSIRRHAARRRRPLRHPQRDHLLADFLAPVLSVATTVNVSPFSAAVGFTLRVTTPVVLLIENRRGSAPKRLYFTPPETSPESSTAAV